MNDRDDPALELIDPVELAEQLTPPTRWLIVLDFDGTLSPIVEHPEDAAPAPGAVDAIRAVVSATPVAIVSGRPITELTDRLGELPVTYAGGHGAEVRTADGRRTTLVDPAAVRGTLDAAQAELADLLDPAAGWQIERKEASLAVHHRRVAEGQREELEPQVRSLLEQRCDDPPGFQLLAGKAVLELRPAGVDKGRALARIAEQYPDLTPLVVGDDVTDEDAFREAASRGGASILVAEHPRDSVARWRLADPDAVVAFLGAFAPPTEG